MDVETIIDRIDFDAMSSEREIYASTIGDDGDLLLTPSERQSMEEWMADYTATNKGLADSPRDQYKTRRWRRRTIRHDVRRKLQALESDRRGAVGLGPLLTIATIAYYVAMIIWMLRQQRKSS